MPESSNRDQEYDASGNSSHSSDASGNSSGRTDSSGNYYYVGDSSANIVSFDLSCDDTLPVPKQIVSDLSSTTVGGIGYVVVHEQGLAADGTEAIRTKFDATHPELYDPDIHENLTEEINTYNDETDPSGQSVILLNQIRSYASQIQCSDFHGKGSIDDYTQLFQAASKIATESKQMELNVDVEGFSEFAQAADDLSTLFTGFITKLQNVNIINDIIFLQAIANALSKIVNLSNIFGKFKQTIFATSTIQFPKSAHDTSVIIQGVMSEVNCAMQYINYFVAPETNPALTDAQLSSVEQNIIAQSVGTINSWNLLCEQGVSIAMSNNVDVQYMQNTSNLLKQKTVSLKNATNHLKSKLAALNILC